MAAGAIMSCRGRNAGVGLTTRAISSALIDANCQPYRTPKTLLPDPTGGRHENATTVPVSGGMGDRQFALNVLHWLSRVLN